jgi:hypothetical protein
LHQSHGDYVACAIFFRHVAKYRQARSEHKMHKSFREGFLRFLCFFVAFGKMSGHF